MQRVKHGEGGWARRLLRGCCIAALLLFLTAPWLVQDRAKAPGDERTGASTVPRVTLAGPLTPEARYITPAGRAAFAFEALLAQRIASAPAVAPPALWAGRAMTAEEFRRMYEGDGADYADVVLGPR